MSDSQKVFVDIGGGAVVSVWDVVAIEWSDINDCPRVHLSSGHTVLATAYKGNHRPKFSQHQTQELLDKFNKAACAPLAG